MRSTPRIRNPYPFTRRLILSAALLCCLLTALHGRLWAQADPQAYRLFRGDGQPVRFRNLVREASRAEVLLFGELHNSPIAHWMERMLAEALYRRMGRLSLGMEMFETDQQGALEGLLSGYTPADSFRTQTRTWPNYETDYEPLVRWAQALALPVVGTNAPRHLARLVFRRGPEALDSLPAAEQRWLAPLPLQIPYENASYRAMEGMMQGSAHGSAHGSTSAADTRRLVAAQALKDATMAQSILQHLQPGQPMLHLNGSYHSDRYEGIVWYLRQARPSLRIRTLSVVQQASLRQLAQPNRGLADYMLVVPETMTPTY